MTGGGSSATSGDVSGTGQNVDFGKFNIGGIGKGSGVAGFDLNNPFLLAGAALLVALFIFKKR